MNNPIVWPAAVFFVSRLGLILIIYVSMIFIPLKDTPGSWRAFPENPMLDGWFRWDSGWYQSIAEEGYILPEKIKPGSARNTAFFPAYPLAIRALNQITNNSFVSGFIISNLCFLMALMLLYRLCSMYYDPPVAKRAVVLLAVFPYSFFFTAMYTESLFLLAVLAAFYSAEKKQWLWAGIFSGLAGATRTVGCLTVVGLLVLYLEQRDFNLKKIRPNILWLLLGAWGPLSYMVFLAIRYGDPFEFYKVQSVAAWSGDLSFFSNFNTDRFYFLLCLLISLVAFLPRYRPRYALALWALMMTLVSYVKIFSFVRLAIVIFPVFMVSARLLDHKFFYRILVAVSAGMMIYFAIGFSHWHWIA